MSNQSMATIVVLRVGSVQLPHPTAQVAINRLDEQVIMIRHLAEGVYDKIVT